MTYQATVYRVLIASPSDVQEERKLIRQAILEWNGAHSANLQVVLLPITWETDSSPEMGDRPQSIINRQIVRNSDILVGIFWTRLGTHTGQAESGTVEEIEEFMQAAKPVMLYFSSVPAVLGTIDLDEYKKLEAFQDRCKRNGIVGDYGTPDELRRQVERHLLDTVRRLKGNEGGGLPQGTNPQENTVVPQSRFSHFDTYLRTLETDLKTELKSGPRGLDDAKRIVASAEPRILDLIADPGLSPSSSAALAVNSILADLKGVQRHQLYMDGGRSFRQFWEAMDDILTRLKKLDAIVHVRAYLESAFRGWVIKDGKQVPRDSYWFSVKNTKTNETHHALVSSEFLDDVPPDHIEETLHAWRVADEMRQAGEDWVLVSNSDAKGRIPRNEI